MKESTWITNLLIIMKYIFTLLSILLTHGLFAQSFVEYHPFLHWKATAQDGLMYSNISIEPVNGKKHLLSNQISPMQTLVIKAFQPTGFQESDGLVYFGMGVKVIDGKTGQKSFEIADIYKNPGRCRSCETPVLKSEIYT